MTLGASGSLRQPSNAFTFPPSSRSIMKILLALAFVAGVSAFAPQPVLTRSSTAVGVAGNMGPSDGWSDKPLYQPKSTPPVADKKVSWLARQAMPDVMIDPSYFLTWAVAALCPLIIWYHPCEFFRLECHQDQDAAIAFPHCIFHSVL